jgi:hypothetical protein
MKSKKIVLNFLILGIYCSIAVSQSACTGGIKYSDVSNHLPNPQPGYGRVYVYSNDYNGQWGFRISADGQNIGKVMGFQTLYVDRPAGTTKITVNSEGTWPGADPKDITLKLGVGETRYIQAGPDPIVPIWAEGNHSPIARIRLIAMDPEQGSSDLHRCFYVGAPVPGMTGG